MPSRTLDFPVFDADNHMYEASDAFTRHLPKEYAGLIRYVEVDGRTKIVVNGRLSEYIPNPTFSVVAAPGAQEDYFRAKNPDSMFKKSEANAPAPTKAGRSGIPTMRAIPAFFEPEPRLKLMDELGLDRALMWPTLASLLEERLVGESEATHAVVHALNQWMHETWTFDFKDRIFATPVITLPLVDRAQAELDWVLERGARVILVRPAPVPGPNGWKRSFALPEFDPFWAKVQEAGVLVGMHSSDSGYQKYTNEWEGFPPGREMLPFERTRTYTFDVLREGPSPVVDSVASIIGHELAHRFPKLKFAPIENGSGWVRPMLTRMADAYERAPHNFPEDPVAVFKRSIFVHPFHEEDPVGLVELLGEDNVLFGSDYPHPEGASDPLGFIDQLEGLPQTTVAKVMGGNLGRLMHVS